MQVAEKVNKQSVVMKAYINAYRGLGLSDSRGAKLIGVGRSTLLRNTEFHENSKQSELQILFIRLYRSLFALFGGDIAAMKHWFDHKNKHVRGVPKDLCFTITGLVNVNAYLDALRGKA